MSEWKSAYMRSSDVPLPEHFRGGCILMTAAAVTAAAVRCFLYPEDPFPLDFCLLCGVIAAGGLVFSGICARWQKKNSLVKALAAPASLCALAVWLVLTGAVLFDVFFEAQYLYRQQTRSFSTPDELVWYMLKQDDARLRELARNDLKAKYSTAELDQAYLDANRKALETSDYKGMGPFLAIGTSEENSEAAVHIVNQSASSITIVCNGPSPTQCSINGNSSGSFRLSPGDYDITVSLADDFSSPRFVSSKHVVGHTRYKAVYILADGPRKANLLRMKDLVLHELPSYTPIPPKRGKKK